MPKVTSIVLDVLKPHEPNILDFANQIANLGDDYQVKVNVEEIDDNTHSVVVEVTGKNLDYTAIVKCVETMGGSVHSLDGVEVINVPTEHS